MQITIQTGPTNLDNSRKNRPKQIKGSVYKEELKKSVTISTESTTKSGLLQNMNLKEGIWKR